MGWLIFTIDNKKRFLLVLIVIMFLSVITSYSIKVTFNNFSDYSFPANGLITYYDNFTNGEQVYDIANYSIPEIEDTVTNVRGVDLAKIEFISDNSQQMKDFVQTKLNKGSKGIKQRFSPIYDSDLLNQFKINIPLVSLDLDHLVIGSYPTKGQMLISEEFATELISELEPYSNYQSLIGAVYEGYTISGVYAASYQTISDEIIVPSPDQPEELINLVIGYNQSTIANIKSNDYDYVTAGKFKQTNYCLLAQFGFIIVALVLLSVCFYKEVISFKQISKLGNVKRLKIYINIILPFIITIVIIATIFTI